MTPDHRLLHEKCGLLCGRTIAIEGGQRWRKTVVPTHELSLARILGREGGALRLWRRAGSDRCLR